MANICSTTYVIKGNKNRLKDLYKEVSRIKAKADKYGEYAELSLLFLDVDPENKEWITEISADLKSKTPYVSITTESKWYRDESTPISFRTLYPGVEVYFLSEELGCEIFETNDPEGKYIPENIIVDSAEGMTYCTREEALKTVCRLLDKNEAKHTLEDLKTLTDERNRKIDKKQLHESYVWLYIPDVV